MARVKQSLLEDNEMNEQEIPLTGKQDYMESNLLELTPGNPDEKSDEVKKRGRKPGSKLNGGKPLTMTQIVDKTLELCTKNKINHSEFWSFCLSRAEGYQQLAEAKEKFDSIKAQFGL